MLKYKFRNRKFSLQETMKKIIQFIEENWCPSMLSSDLKKKPVIIRD